jgi:protein-S-isoprenylcysteine O-methyltransferase Ste14
LSAATNPWARWRVRLGYPLAIAFAWLADPTLQSLIWGAVVALLGLLLRASAAGHLYKHQRLATSGPYRFTRNPLYLGSALLALGLLLAGRSWIAAALVAAYFAVFYSGVMRTEEAELRAQYGADFDAYAARVPLFLPSFRAPLPAGERFRGKQYASNREYQAALGFALALALLYAKMKWTH